MTEAPRFPDVHIDAASLHTELVEGVNPSLIGLPMRRLICTGQDVITGTKFVQVGSVKDLSWWLLIEASLDTREIVKGRLWNMSSPAVTVKDAFLYGLRNVGFDSHLDDLELEQDPDLIRRGFADGNMLVFGPHTVTTREIEPATVDPQNTGVWIPFEGALEPDWKMAETR